MSYFSHKSRGKGFGVTVTATFNQKDKCWTILLFKNEYYVIKK